jgi:hypothetical protein
VASHVVEADISAGTVLIFDELSLVTEKDLVTIIRHMHCGVVHQLISDLDPLKYSACGRNSLHSACAVFSRWIGTSEKSILRTTSLL